MIDRLDRSIDPWKDSVIDARRKSQLRVLTTSSPTIARASIGPINGEGWPEPHRLVRGVRLWHLATFRCEAPIRSLSEA